eukprot:6211059-Pleurochrysis_carterae.AAC.1
MEGVHMSVVTFCAGAPRAHCGKRCLPRQGRSTEAHGVRADSAGWTHPPGRLGAPRYSLRRTNARLVGASMCVG